MADLPDRPAASRRAWLWGPVAVYALAIFLVSASPAPASLPGGVTDKQGHLAAYAGLSLVTLRALAGGNWGGVTLGRAAGAALLSTAFGASDEVHQQFVPGRTGDPADLAADTVGAVLAAAAAWGVARYRAGGSPRDRI